MREIKFRCFYRGVMYPVKEMQFNTDGSFSVSIIEMDLDDLGVRDVSPDSEHVEGIMQYIGRKDINGIDVYEGDIVRIIEPNRLYSVEWAEFGFKLFHADPNLNKLQWGGLNRVAELKWTIEVIGNTYEHKHSLK